MSRATPVWVRAECRYRFSVLRSVAPENLIEFQQLFVAQARPTTVSLQPVKHIREKAPLPRTERRFRQCSANIGFEMFRLEEHDAAWLRSWMALHLARRLHAPGGLFIVNPYRGDGAKYGEAIPAEHQAEHPLFLAIAKTKPDGDQNNMSNKKSNRDVDHEHNPC
ncbi:hypothetical protein N2599_24090 (plasmid) [Rhizobium sullae]|uniref:Uncharacterized protein n=1 Tax=Rhizobium sullae TaxID=50338 RepID=A0ABY5XWH2_RHISU|nr:hypothetical protein [Rhizobium sullae]UWU18327.1 hypothetical protein N2599_24090 [Rhizobium sullae]